MTICRESGTRMPGGRSLKRSLGRVSLEKLGSRNGGLSTNRSQGRAFEFGMVGHGERRLRAVGILPDHGDMFMFAHQPESEPFESLDHSFFGCVGWKSRHYAV